MDGRAPERFRKLTPRVIERPRGRRLLAAHALVRLRPHPLSQPTKAKVSLIDEAVAQSRLTAAQPNGDLLEGVLTASVEP